MGYGTSDGGDSGLGTKTVFYLCAEIYSPVLGMSLVNILQHRARRSNAL